MHSHAIPHTHTHDARSPCRCVATLQGLQLRELVAASLGDFLAFFRQHAAVAALDASQDTQRCGCRAVMVTELAAHDGGLARRLCAFGVDRAGGCLHRQLSSKSRAQTSRQTSMLVVPMLLHH